MKRYGTSITALALAGAMTLSIAPHASAQSSYGAEIAGSSINAAIDEVTKPVADPLIGYLSATATGQSETVILLPALGEWKAGGEAGMWGGKSWFYLPDGVTVTTDEALAKQADAKATGNLETEMSIIELAVVSGRSVPANKAEELRAKYLVALATMKSLPDWKTGGEIVVGEGAEQKVYKYHSDGIHVVAADADINGAIAADTKTFFQLSRELNWLLPKNLVERSLTVSASGQAGTGTGAEGSAAAQTGSSSVDSLPAFKIGEFAGKLNGEDWFYASREYVVKNKDLIGKPRIEGDAGWMSIAAFAQALGKSLPRELNGESHYQLTSSTADLAFAAAMALPAILIIGGVNWYLNQDGRTYVMDITRTSSVPTAWEREASANMLSSNRAEVEAQMDSSTSTEGRGITADTGSNEFGKGLIALLLASVLGAAVFAFGRRQLV